MSCVAISVPSFASAYLCLYVSLYAYSVHAPRSVHARRICLCMRAGCCSCTVRTFDDSVAYLSRSLYVRVGYHTAGTIAFSKAYISRAFCCCPAQSQQLTAASRRAYYRRLYAGVPLGTAYTRPSQFPPLSSDPRLTSRPAFLDRSAAAVAAAAA